MRVNPKVIDISHYDDVETSNGQWTGFQKVKAAGYVGVINKVTEGRGMVDKSYKMRRIPARSAGLLWGAYHYMDSSNPIDQADNFLSEATVDDQTLMALDYEERAVSLDAAADFLQEVKNRTGRFPWLYSGFLIKERLGSRKDPFWAQIKLWLSHYNVNPTWPLCWDAPSLWQFTGDGVGPLPHTVPGVTIAGGCDINSFAGTDDQLATIWAK